MMSKWLTQSSNKDNKFIREQARIELKQGDLCLYEKEDLTQYAMFKLSAKYMLFHSTRVCFLIWVEKIRVKQLQNLIFSRYFHVCSQQQFTAVI